MKAGLFFMAGTIVALAGLLPAPGAADTPSFDRYALILTRKPFGAPPPPPAPPPAPVVEEPKFTEGYRLSMIVQSKDGKISVGFVDKENKRYMMRVGETRDSIGITVVSADYKNGEVVLRKGDRTETLRRSDKPGAAAPAITETPRKKADDARAGYAERRRARLTEQRLREEQEARNPPKSEFTDEAALAEHLHNYQLEVIRQGLPPLPIPLTQEQDDQLVAEGYLPPTQ